MSEEKETPTTREPPAWVEAADVNRRTINREIIENHFEGLCHLLGRLDPPDPELRARFDKAKGWLQRLRLDLMPGVYRQLAMDAPMRVDQADLVAHAVELERRRLVAAEARRAELAREAAQRKEKRAAAEAKR